MQELLDRYHPQAMVDNISWNLLEVKSHHAAHELISAACTVQTVSNVAPGQVPLSSHADSNSTFLELKYDHVACEYIPAACTVQIVSHVAAGAAGQVPSSGHVGPQQHPFRRAM